MNFSVFRVFLSCIGLSYRAEVHVGINPGAHALFYWKTRKLVVFRQSARRSKPRGSVTKQSISVFFSKLIINYQRFSGGLAESSISKIINKLEKHGNSLFSVIFRVFPLFLKNVTFREIGSQIRTKTDKTSGTTRVSTVVSKQWYPRVPHCWLIDCIRKKPGEHPTRDWLTDWLTDRVSQCTRGSG